MTQEKNLKNVKVVKHWETGERHYEDCGEIDINFYGACNCTKRAKEFAGWKITDLASCTMEATGIYDKRLMARTNLKYEGVLLHCSQHCADTWKSDKKYN